MGDEGREDEKDHHYKLYYFNIQGRAEPIRMMFAYSGLPFEDFRFEMADWPKIKPTMPFGQVPALEVDGKLLGETMAICRYLGQKMGMAGINSWQNAQCDMMGDAFSDTLTGLKPFFLEQDPEKKKAVWKELTETVVKPFLSRQEQFLKQNNSGFLVGDKLTWIDLVVFSLTSEFHLKHPELFEGLPHLQKFISTIADIPSIKHWIETRPSGSFAP